MTNPYFLHHYLAEQADSRLDIVRHTPQNIILAGADADFSRQKLAARYPQAKFSEYDPHAERLQHAAAQRKPNFIHKITGKIIAQQQQNPQDKLPENHADMLWANLNLVWANDLVATFENWSQALRKDGLLFFTHFGADSLPEIRQIIDTKNSLLRDMHDLGDMLFHHGFYDPVMDTAQLVLTYAQAETFWQDMETAGLWHALHVSDDVAARNIVQQAWQNSTLTQITLETVFAHALKKRKLPQNEQLVQFYPQGNKTR